jgi:uncharacterized membrane protein
MKYDKTSWHTDIAGRFDAETNEKARIASSLGYLFFFIPLIMHPESKFARYHSNQGFLLMLLTTVGLMLVSLIPYAGPFLIIIIAIYSIVFGIRGFIIALQGKAKHIPLVGKLVIIQFDNFYSLEG